MPRSLLPILGRDVILGAEPVPKVIGQMAYPGTRQVALWLERKNPYNKGMFI
jgi:hypothetical protein